MNGYNFTERVRTALGMAREDAVRLHHEYVGTEHILLGLIREGEGVAATVLQNLHADLDDIRQATEEMVKKGKVGQTTGPDLPYTSRAKKVLELAMSEARELDHKYVGTEHLLLGLLREERGIAAQVLRHFGVTTENARAETLRILGTGNSSEQPATRSATSERVEFRGIQQRPAEGGDLGELTRLSGRVRKVLDSARTVATEFGAPIPQALHVAIALVRHGEGVANTVVDRLGCDRSGLLGALVAAARPASAEPSDSPMQWRFVIGSSITVDWESGRWSAEPVTTLHVLLALLTQPDIASIFASHGVTANRVTTEAERISG